MSSLLLRPYLCVSKTHVSPCAAVCFTDHDKDQMRRFSPRSYLLDKPCRQAAWLGLVDVLLAYAYDQRFTDGEPTVSAHVRSLPSSRPLTATGST